MLLCELSPVKDNGRADRRNLQRARRKPRSTRQLVESPCEIFKQVVSILYTRR